MIQRQDRDGTWLDVHLLNNPTDKEVAVRLREAKRTYAQNRVRAVDQGSGTLVDLLG